MAIIWVGWMVQKYWKVPASLNVREKDSPSRSTPESQLPLAVGDDPDVTVWGMSRLVQVIVSPTEMVTGVGLKKN